MPNYIFRIIENDKTHTPYVNQLIDEHKGKYNVMDTKDGFIYETEFEKEEDLEKFKAGLNKMFAGS